MLVFAQISCTNDWAAKFDGEPISIDEFNKIYYLMGKQRTGKESREEIDKEANRLAEEHGDAFKAQDPLYKPFLLNQLIQSKLIYSKAMNDKTIDKDELKTVIELVKTQGVVQYYLDRKLKNQIVISKEDITAAYEKNKKQFGMMKPDEAENYIRSRLYNQAMLKKQSEFISNLMSETKIEKKNEFK